MLKSTLFAICAFLLCSPVVSASEQYGNYVFPNGAGNNPGDYAFSQGLGTWEDIGVATSVRQHVDLPVAGAFLESIAVVESFPYGDFSLSVNGQTFAAPERTLINDFAWLLFDTGRLRLDSHSFDFVVSPSFLGQIVLAYPSSGIQNATLLTVSGSNAVATTLAFPLGFSVHYTSTVPEPHAYGLTLLGLAVVALAVRRRSGGSFFRLHKRIASM